jgi:hypothetical protein
MMSDKAQMLKLCKEEFNRWEDLLNSLNEAQITTPLAHLEAGLLHKEPDYPPWPASTEVGDEGDVNAVNAWIYEKYRDLPRSTVHENWRNSFRRFMELGEAIPEKDLMDANKYVWMKGYPLFGVIEGSYEHHHIDHFPPIHDWFQKHPS